MKRDQIKFKVKGFSGESAYNLEPLTRRESMEVFHKSAQIIAQAVGLVTESDTEMKALSSVVKSLDPGTLWSIAKAVFREAVIVNENGKFEITDLDESDYFDNRPEEFYLALAYAIKENYPKVFFTLQEALGVSLDEMLELGGLHQKSPKQA